MLCKFRKQPEPMKPKFKTIQAWEQAQVLMQPAFIRVIDNIRKELEVSAWQGSFPLPDRHILGDHHPGLRSDFPSHPDPDFHNRLDPPDREYDRWGDHAFFDRSAASRNHIAYRQAVLLYWGCGRRGVFPFLRGDLPH